MGIFSSPSAFDPIVDKVTDENKKEEDWGLIMEVCDRVGATTTGPKECLKAIIRRLNHQDPHVVQKALTLLDACVNNCGQYFLLEVASRDFETEYKRLLNKSHPKIQERLRSMLKKWAETTFATDPKYSLIPSLYNQLKRDGHTFSPEGGKKEIALPKDPNVVSSKQEEDDIAKAIQLSLQETSAKTSRSSSSVSGGSALYPTEVLYGASGGAAAPLAAAAAPADLPPQVQQKKARCLYDFEAAEDNELTFKAGEIVLILDDQDPNWWKGSNHRGEGLFPANFVTYELEQQQQPQHEADRKRSVQFNEEVEVKTVEQVTFPAQTTIDEEKISQLLEILHEADPTDETDPPQLPRLEEQVDAMSPLIDAELERVDRRHAQLTRLSHELVDALSLYHTLMRDMPPAYAAYQPPSMVYPAMNAAAAGMPPPSYMAAMAGYGSGGMMGMLPPGGMVLPGGGVAPPAAGSAAVNGMPSPYPMYYMDPGMYPGSAPPPTPPLQDAAGGYQQQAADGHQQQQQLYSQHTQ